MPTLTNLADCYQIYSTLHEADNNFCAGGSIEEQLPRLMQLVWHSNIKTAIDYGCGKGVIHDRLKVKRLLRLEEMTLYDPAVLKYSAYPAKAAELVICVDVLEHVPEHLIDDVLQDIASLATKAVYITISTKPAKKVFADGENLHVTQKPLHWWREKIASMPVYTVVNASA